MALRTFQMFQMMAMMTVELRSWAAVSFKGRVQTIFVQHEAPPASPLYPTE
jgi:hypothetical protein